jgi:ribulose-phosphate 3-epimerase
MVQVAPSLLSANFARLAEEIQRVEALADLLHVDIMDGHFVPNITMGPMIVEAIRKTSELPLDVHMMVEEPDRYLSEFRQAGADMMSVHVETCPHLERTIDQIHQLGALAGVALNPATPVELLVDIFDEVDYVLVMSVNPGFGGQAFWPRAAEKIRRVKAMRGDRDRPLIEVDGGINETTVQVVREAGVDIVVAGSYVFQAADPGERVKILRGG